MKQSSGRIGITICIFSVLLLLPLASLIAQTSFVKGSNNPVLPLGDPGAWDEGQAAYGDVLFDGSTYHIWYGGNSNSNLGGMQIGYATSSDGSQWTRPTNNPVIPLGSTGQFDDIGVWGPTVTFDGSLFEMWYCGGTSGFLFSIGYATATDPAVWTKHAGNAAVLTKGSTGAWDESLVCTPVVMRSDTLYRMWYTGRSASGIFQTGYATSTDGISWSKYADNPVLRPGAPGEWDSEGTLAGSVIFENGQFQMWYHGSTDGLNRKIGYATSPDGITWTKYSGNPILEPDPGTWDSGSVRFPKVIKDGGLYMMWYTGESNGVNRVGFASAVTAIERFSVAPERFDLRQNYPNPFNPATTIEFTLLTSASVTIKVFDISGRDVATLVENEVLASGHHRRIFDAGHLTSGIYFYRMQAGEFSTGSRPDVAQTRKLILLR